MELVKLVVGWLVGWLVVWMVGWLVGWLTCGPIGGVKPLSNGPRGSARGWRELLIEKGARVRRELSMANRVGFLEKALVFGGN